MRVLVTAVLVALHEMLMISCNILFQCLVLTRKQNLVGPWLNESVLLCSDLFIDISFIFCLWN